VPAYHSMGSASLSHHWQCQLSVIVPVVHDLSEGHAPCDRHIIQIIQRVGKIGNHPKHAKHLIDVTERRGNRSRKGVYCVLDSCEMERW